MISSKAYLRQKANDIWNDLLLLGHNSNPLLVAEKGLIHPTSNLFLFDILIQEMSNFEIAVCVYNLTNKQKISSTSSLILERISKGEKIDQSETTEELKKYL